MKFLLKPVLALALLAMMATGAKAQDTLRISLKEAIQIALSENPTIKEITFSISFLDLISSIICGDMFILVFSTFQERKAP